MRISREVIRQLEFDKVISAIQDSCAGQIAKEQLSKSLFKKDFGEVKEQLHAVAELLVSKQDGFSFSLRPYESISDDLFMLKKEGYVLGAETVLKLLTVLSNYNDFFNVVGKRKVQCPTLYELTVVDDYSDVPLNSIQRVFDETGEVRPNASPELSRIFKKIENTQRELDASFNDMVKRFRNENVLSDNVESWRNGRRVLVVPAENKRKIEGVVHDQSASGKTVFIEPQAVMTINNNLFSLENEKRAEVYKILAALSDELRDHTYMINQIGERLGQIDIIQAKTNFSHKINGILPKLTDEPILHVKELRHPLLILAEKESGNKVVPLDLVLEGKNRLLLISGPNAGGKSVSLKAVGLAHLMLYSGILIPVHPDSVIGRFEAIFSDIGDHQNIDEGLSTYSSHLTNLKNIVNHSNERSLILLDEIGSGTDPKLGGAIAEGIIKSLVEKKAFGIVTTHYSDLKVFAFRNRGVVNGAMLFDKENLQPTYQLKVGKPGSSYAFEVAKKIGLNTKIIQYAKKKVGKKENQVEDLLINLQQNKARLEDKIAGLESQQEKLDRLIKNYENLSKEFEVKRKKLQIRSKEVEYKRANDENLELQKLISKLEKEKDLEEAKKRKEVATTKRQSEGKEIISIKKDLFNKRKTKFKVEKGVHVKLVDSDMAGEVLSVTGKKAEVLFGLMKMTVPIIDLLPGKDQIEINRTNRINIKGVAFENNFSPKLDIRGYKMQDADVTLQLFFDKALLSNARLLEVVHGKGSGALRKLVRSKINEYNDLIFDGHPVDEQGGDGVTVVKL